MNRVKPDLSCLEACVPTWAQTLAMLCLCMPALALALDQVHIVQPGDNLHDLARRYLDDPAQWPQLQQANGVSHPRRLKPGSRLVIPAALARPDPAPADVLHVARPASVRRDAITPAVPLAAGERVTEGAQIEVGDGGFVTLRLADGSVVRLAAGTQLRLRELRHAPASGQSQSGIELERGRVDATVTPLRTPRSRFEVHTPRAVGGVRGTTFGVAVAEGGDFLGDVREGAIQVRAQAALPGRSALVGAGQGARMVASSGAIAVTPLLPPPDLSRVPGVVEDISLVELPLSPDPAVSAWQVRIASDASVEHVVRNGTFRQPAARFAGLDDGSYLLAVRAMDRQGIPGAEAVRQLVVNARPQAPLLREPRPDSERVASDVTLLCTEGTGALGYIFQLARDETFEDLVVQSPDVDQCRYTAPALAPGRYFWRVASIGRDAQDRRDQGPFSQPAMFRVLALPPVPSAPTVRQGGVHTLAIAWNASSGGLWRHQIQIAHDAAFTRLLNDELLTEPVFTRAMPPAGIYHVRVRQVDAQGLQGAWTDTQRLSLHGHVATTDAQPLTSAEGEPVRLGAP